MNLYNNKYYHWLFKKNQEDAKFNIDKYGASITENEKFEVSVHRDTRLSFWTNIGILTLVVISTINYFIR